MRLDEYTKGKLDFEFLPAIYSEFTNIPFVINMFPFSNETADAPDPKWLLQNVYPLNRDADALIFICRYSDWKDNNTSNGLTYGYTYNQYPISPPSFIPILADRGDRSWKFHELYALEHYIPHELGHVFSKWCEINDRTHELDYSGQIDKLYDLFDYDKIKSVLSNRRILDGQMANFYFKQGDPTGYVAVEGKLVGISTDDVNLKKDWPTAKFITLSPDEFLKFDLANYHTLSKRK